MFPGGGVEENEGIEEAVCREIKEEASLEIKVTKLLYRLTDENCEHFFYLCEYVAGEPELGEGNERHLVAIDNQYRPEWHRVSELPSLAVYPLEVRDWFLADLIAGFKSEVRHEEILTNDRRSAYKESL